MAKAGERSENWSHGHGGNPLTGEKPSATYVSWCAMKARCLRPRDRFFDRYGGRGIRVCTRWLSFNNFLADMGVRPEGASLDRFDTNGDYTPENCHWASPREQQRNRTNNKRVTWRGRTLCLAEWCEQLGLHYYTVHDRLSRGGWTAERALTTPTRKPPVALTAGPR